ncbi:MAG: thioesterase family protein [Candidatus Nanopelagicales bacterium]
MRPSSVSVSPTPPDPVPRDQCMEMPHLPGITPDFARNFTMSFATGIPFTGSTEPRITGWCRHLTPAVGVAAVSALVDAWPGSVLPVLTRPAPASTVRWSLQFPGASDVAADEWCWYENETVTAQGGYSTMTARLWQDGRLLSWSEQVLTVFERPAEG